MILAWTLAALAFVAPAPLAPPATSPAPVLTPAPAPAATPDVAPAPAPEAPAPSPVADPPDDPALHARVTVLAAGGDVTLVAEDGSTVAAIPSGEERTLVLPPGRYSIRDAHGRGRAVVLTGGQNVRVARPGPPGPPPPNAHHRRSRWKRVVAPLMSALVPGTGQMLNDEYGKGAGMFLGAASLGLGAFALRRAHDPLDFSQPGLGATTFGSEAIQAAGYGVLTGGLHLLWAAQVMDAYAGAAGIEKPTPHVQHRVSLQATRMATVAYRAGDPAADFYPDWNLSVMGQVFRRLSVGLSDLSIKWGPGRSTYQAGVRLHYRFYDRGRFWLGGALGMAFQGTVGRSAPSIDAAVAIPARQTAFTAIPYGQLDLRLFILDRWSLDLVPRVSVPLGTRFYGGDRALPRSALTFELGTGVGVYF